MSRYVNALIFFAYLVTLGASLRLSKLDKDQLSHSVTFNQTCKGSPISNATLAKLLANGAVDAYLASYQIHYFTRRCNSVGGCSSWSLNTTSSTTCNYCNCGCYTATNNAAGDIHLTIDNSGLSLKLRSNSTYTDTCTGVGSPLLSCSPNFYKSSCYCNWAIVSQSYTFPITLSAQLTDSCVSGSYFYSTQNYYPKVWYEGFFNFYSTF